MSFVSILTAAHNAEAFFGETAASVLSQDYSDWNWVVVDDGSSDGTARLVSELDDDRITLIRQSNQGVSAARNRALEHVIGRYVTFLDSDDRLPPQSLSQRVAFLDANPDVGILSGSIVRFDKRGFVSLYKPSRERCDFLFSIAQLREEVFCGPFYMFRADFLDGLKFPVGVTHCEDLIYFTEMAHEWNLVHAGIHECVYEYRLHANSAMTDLNGIEQGYYAFLRRLRGMDRVSPEIRRQAKRRVTSILFKSWLRRSRLDRALRSASYVARL